ncbi:DNA recombination protein RmuC [Rothia sp. CCM 9417]|uniref:DNA recombination protein RmuC n=1 Tax=Rothia sp. CCM 9417 TaxID=3402657 RepID=UPI003AE88A39
MATPTVLLAIILALVLGTLAGFFWGRAGSGSTDALREKNAQLTADLAAAQRAETLLSERVRELQARAEADEDVLLALAPVKTQLATMEKSVRTMETQRAQQYGGLAQALNETNKTSHQLREVTGLLSSALRSTSARGSWGEAQLRRVVEAAGMLRHVTFSEQSTTVATDSRGQERQIRPDMVVHLPGGKTVVLDAKAPLSSYLDAQEAEGPVQAELLGRHAKAVRAHLDALASKQYWAGFGASPELVLCFIPVESALSAALTADAKLLDYAAAKNVALVSPVSLLAALKAISFSWRQDALTDNARELFNLSQQLYERLGTAGSHLAGMGKSLARTVDSYNALVGSLETRVFVTARKMTALSGVQDATGHLSPTPSEASLKPLTAPEFMTSLPQYHAESTQRKENIGPEPYDSWTDEPLFDE